MSSTIFQPASVSVVLFPDRAYDGASWERKTGFGVLIQPLSQQNTDEVGFKVDQQLLNFTQIFPLDLAT